MIVECPECHNRYDVTGRPAGTRARCRCGAIFPLPEPDSSAAMLSCPSCGAAVPHDAHNCQYCGVELMVKACPRCFAKIFSGAEYCSHCGAEVDVPAHANPDGTAARRKCPCCKHAPALDSHLVEEVLLDECPDCHGIFLDSGALERIVEERRSSSARALLESTTHATSTPGPAPAPRRDPMYIRCPDCGTVMNRRNFGRHSGIVVDTCRAHGTWFDADELPRVIQFVIDGGLERAEMRELEQKREEARAAEAAARSAATPAMVTDQHGVLMDIFGGLLGSIGGILDD